MWDLFCALMRLVVGFLVGYYLGLIVLCVVLYEACAHWLHAMGKG